MKAKSNILVCIDITSASITALRYACYKAKKTGFCVNIVAVIESSHKGLLFASRAVGKDKRLQIEDHLKKLTKKVNEEINIMPAITIKEGNIATEIIQAAKEDKNCAMIILGKSSTSLSDNTVIPTISRKIGNKIRVPVVIVPENMSEECLKRLT